MSARGRWSNVNAKGRRRVPGSMNKVETLYAEELERLKADGSILWWGFESVSIRLGKGSRYEPDFLVLEPDGTLVVVEVKGTAGWKLDAESRTKWISAAEKFPFLVFRVATRQRVKDGGGFLVSDYDNHGPVL